MLMTALRRLRDEEDGFTLIELMVVVMILAILIVMGMPTFLGVRARFQDRAPRPTFATPSSPPGSSTRTTPRSLRRPPQARGS